MARPKIGAVSYLNTLPLVEGLMESAPEFDVVFDLPSRLADRLADGELEVALIPVIEAVSHPQYTVVSDACIACRGPVWSVKVLSRVPGEEIATIQLDEGSRTSSVLTRIMLDQKFNVRPTFRPLPIDEDWRTADADAVLIIGDRAMKAEDDRFPYVWDLGETWNQSTAKPFVFAVWAARPGADLGCLSEILTESRDRGLKNIQEIARQNASRYGLSEDECLSYLQNHLHFHLGDDEKSGMNQYFQFAAELSLISNTQPIQYHDCQTAG